MSLKQKDPPIFGTNRYDNSPLERGGPKGDAPHVGAGVFVVDLSRLVEHVSGVGSIRLVQPVRAWSGSGANVADLSAWLDSLRKPPGASPHRQPVISGAGGP